MLQEDKTTANKTKRRVRLMDAVSQIRKCYPNIKATEIRFAAMVFYPIASVDVIALENSIEDYDTVQFMVLRFFALGMDRDTISKLTGLTPTYVSNVQKVLYGYGHIKQDGSVTELGQKSIDESIDKNAEIKIEQKESQRSLQLDALMLSIIPYEKSVDELSFCEKAEADAYKNVGVVAYPEGIDEESLKRQLEGVDYEKMVEVGDIHVNTVEITSVERLKLRYAIACMLVLEGSQTPIVFGRRRWQKRKKGAKGFGATWIPFGIAQNGIREQYAFGNDVKGIKVESEAENYLGAMKKRFEVERERLAKVKVRGKRPKKEDFGNDDEAWHEAVDEWEKPLSEENLRMVLWEAVSDFYPFDEKCCQWQDRALFIEGTAFLDYEGFRSHVEAKREAINARRREKEESEEAEEAEEARDFKPFSFESAKNMFVSSLARVLMGFAADGVFPLVKEKLCGQVIMLRPVVGDMLLEEVSGLLKQAVDRYGGYLVDKHLREHFLKTTVDKNEEKENILVILERVLAGFLDKDESEEDSENDG